MIFNTGWMNHYLGQTKTDRLINGGAYVKENHHGGEMWNFLPMRGRCYAFVRPVKDAGINLERLGVSPETDYVDGVTVVLTATRPEGGRVVVGWFKNARVWRERQEITSRGPRQGWEFHAEAKARNCRLLKPDERTFRLPSARRNRWGIGQSNVRFVDERASKKFVERLVAYMANPEAPEASARKRSGSGGGPRQSDPFLRAKVEKAAITRVTKYYDRMGFGWTSVEAENKGWDLEVTRGDLELLVEVKGCSGPNAIVELTPNEYEAMRNHESTFRLAIVADALRGRAAKLRVLSYQGFDRSWRDEDGNKAELQRRIGLKVSLE